MTEDAGGEGERVSMNGEKEIGERERGEAGRQRGREWERYGGRARGQREMREDIRRYRIEERMSGSRQ